MREDFFKVIVERERINSGNKTAKRRLRRQFKDPRGFDDAASFDGAGRTRKYGRNWDESEAKQLNENLGPMRRALRKFVGRPWNKVYSEFRASLNVKSATHKHVIDHLKQYVEMEIIMSDTKPSVPLHKSHRGSRDGGYIPYTTHSSQHPSFYVNPVTGILCIAPMWKRPKKDDKGPGFFIKKNAAQEPVFYLRHNSLWFCFVMSRLPAGRQWGDQQSWRRKALNQGPAAISAGEDIKDTYWQWMYRHEKAKSYSDRFTGAVGYIDGFSVGTSYGTYHDRYYCSGKMRQLGKAELKELGLKNK